MSVQNCSLSQNVKILHLNFQMGPVGVERDQYRLLALSHRHRLLLPTCTRPRFCIALICLGFSCCHAAAIGDIGGQKKKGGAMAALSSCCFSDCRLCGDLFRRRFRPVCFRLAVQRLAQHPIERVRHHALHFEVHPQPDRRVGRGHAPARVREQVPDAETRCTLSEWAVIVLVLCVPERSAIAPNERPVVPCGPFGSSHSVAPPSRIMIARHPDFDNWSISGKAASRNIPERPTLTAARAFQVLSGKPRRGLLLAAPTPGRPRWPSHHGEWLDSRRIPLQRPESFVSAIARSPGAFASITPLHARSMISPPRCPLKIEQLAADHLI